MILKCDVGGWIGPQPALPFLCDWFDPPEADALLRFRHHFTNFNRCCIAFSLLGEESGIRLPDG